MFSTSKGQNSSSDGNLEDRLRGMILSNKIESPASGHSPSKKGSAGGEASPSRKRPNQAQRRQLNAQFSVPADPRYGAHVSEGVDPSSNFLWQPPQNRSQTNQVHQFQQHLQPSPESSKFALTQSPQFQNSQLSLRSPWNHSQTSRRPPQFSSRQSFSQARHHSSHDSYTKTPHLNQQLYQPISGSSYGRGKPPGNGDEILIQSGHIDKLVHQHVPIIEIDSQESAQKEAFRLHIEQKCRAAISQLENESLSNKDFDSSTVELRCFGSLASGFATKASDMDLALLTPKSNPPPDSPDSPIPRLLEKALLDLGYGARLLTKTRIPIIKLCEKPTSKLLADLREEHSKWENGCITESFGDEEPEINLVVGNKETHGHGDGEFYGQIQMTREHTGQQMKTMTYNDRLTSLKQKNNQSLGDYYNAAKRLLKQLGGHDITSSAPELSNEELNILNDVCRVFIIGLSSQILSDRLRNYKSIDPLFNKAVPSIRRSLQGIWNQVEGVRLALAWDTRPLNQSNDKDEFESLQAVQAWQSLQNKEGHVVETATYNRQLYVALERLKRISSLQLAFLQQNQHEDPLHYLIRTQKILDDLKAPEDVEADSVTPTIISCYISGIYDDSIRKLFMESSSSGSTLQQIGLQHRALQLALDYEHALEAGMFSEDGQLAVTQYIRFLRSRTFSSQTSLIEIEPSLLANIRKLADPTSISLNKPRDKYKDHLEFPKTDSGLQCDINFSADLAIQNTLLLRCYAHTDTRVREMVLFVKYWAKKRAINTPYRGTLSSYGFVLMVLHYLINVVRPFVCPNLQTMNSDPPPYLPPAEKEARTLCRGRDVRFWRNEIEIQNLAQRKLLNHNHDSVGLLLRGFFEYFAQNGQMSTIHNRGFDWGREVLSLRTPGGILTKQEKGWVGAKTTFETTAIAIPLMPHTPRGFESSDVTGVASTCESNAESPQPYNKTIEEVKEIRHRYLFAIEDPFELDHNVARTVTHNGIVSIRDEFRRAWRIIKGMGKPYEGHEGGLLEPVSTTKDATSLHSLLDLLHGRDPKAKS